MNGNQQFSQREWYESDRSSRRCRGLTNVCEVIHSSGVFPQRGGSVHAPERLLRLCTGALRLPVPPEATACLSRSMKWALGGLGRCVPEWWARLDSNQRPSGYEPPALTPELRARRAGDYP